MAAVPEQRDFTKTHILRTLVRVARDPQKPFLPQGGCARVLVGVLALPLFVASLVVLIAIPTTKFLWPPQSFGDIIALFTICNILAAVCLFTFLALLWAIATPRWIAVLLHTGSRRLISMTGGVMITTGIGLAISTLHSPNLFVFVFAALNVIIGIRFIYTTAHFDAPDVYPVEHVDGINNE